VADLPKRWFIGAGHINFNTVYQERVEKLARFFKYYYKKTKN
jgi:hypothetical protein